jgi:phospholipid transport system transporter-binding protein
MSIACDGGRCTVQGPITMGNVTAVLEESSRLFASPSLLVDLAGVTEVDSAAVSLLLEWRREAAKANRRIDYANVPANLKSLAELYGVSHLIGA